MTVYFQGEMKRISAEIDEEILSQEAETTFLHSESYQFVKQLDDNILDLDGVYHLVLSSIGDTPLVTVSNLIAKPNAISWFIFCGLYSAPLSTM